MNQKEAGELLQKISGPDQILDRDTVVSPLSPIELGSQQSFRQFVNEYDFVVATNDDNTADDKKSWTVVACRKNSLRLYPSVGGKVVSTDCFYLKDTEFRKCQVVSLSTGGYWTWIPYPTLSS